MKLFLFGINCNNSAGKKKEKEEIETILDESKNQRRIKIESFKEQINGLGTDCLSFSMDSIIFSNGQTIDSSIHKWLFGLEKKDSLQFKRADLIRPICKLNENNNILSVIFSDKYDYKSAIHIFNFRKSDFKPVSSFILYEIVFLNLYYPFQHLIN